jgi:aromatic-amino-acid transaminase
MRARVAAMRAGLHDALRACMPDGDFSYLSKQTGMFSYTGLSPQQVAAMREDSAVYLVGTGRLCLAALTADTVPVVAQAMSKVLQAR